MHLMAWTSVYRTHRQNPLQRKLCHGLGMARSLTGDASCTWRSTSALQSVQDLKLEDSLVCTHSDLSQAPRLCVFHGFVLNTRLDSGCLSIGLIQDSDLGAGAETKSAPAMLRSTKPQPNVDVCKQG